MLFAMKVALASCVIAYSSWLAGRRPVLAGFIVALPLTSVLSILFAYAEHRDMQKVNEFAVSILIAVPLSLTFFLPFVLNRWLKLGFVPTFAISVLLVAVCYAATAAFKRMSGA